MVNRNSDTQSDIVASMNQAFDNGILVVGETCNFQYTLGSRHFD